MTTQAIEMKPTVGRIVHFYRTPASEPVPALVLRVYERTKYGPNGCLLQAFIPGVGPVQVDGVEQGAPSDGGAWWEWPTRDAPRVPAPPVDAAPPGTVPVRKDDPTSRAPYQRPEDARRAAIALETTGHADLVTTPLHDAITRLIRQAREEGREEGRAERSRSGSLPAAWVEPRATVPATPRPPGGSSPGDG